MSKKPKEFYSLTVQPRVAQDGSVGKLARPVIPGHELERGEATLKTAVNQGFEYRTIWNDFLRCWLTIPRQEARRVNELLVKCANCHHDMNDSA